VVVGPEYGYVTGEPQRTLDARPTIAEQVGLPEVQRVRMEGVEVYDEPRVIDGLEGVTGVAQLRSCVDVTAIQAFDVQGTRLDLEDGTGTQVLTLDLGLWRLPHPLTGVEGWYLATKTGTRAAACAL
jgi:hypothetical protein